MDVEMMKSAVDLSLKLMKSGEKLIDCPKECEKVGCELASCMENGLMGTYIRELAELSETLDQWSRQYAYEKQHLHLWVLDMAVMNLQLVHELDVDHYNRPVVIILNGKPHVLDMNPAMANDLQRLLHRQIAMHYADDIE